MFDFISLYLADKYMPLSNKQKQHKQLRLERADEKIWWGFRIALAICIISCTPWNIYDIAHGEQLRGIIDMFIEYLIYPAVILLLCHHIRQGRFGLIVIMAAALFAMLWHTPSYWFMLVWCAAFVTVRFQISGMQNLPGYPGFHDDMRGKTQEDILTEDQRFAVFQSEVKRSNQIIWHDEQDQQHTAEDILSGKVGIDEFYGIQKCDNPGVMEELIIPDDLDLEGSECLKK